MPSSSAPSSSQIKPCIAITSGEPAGIGPDIIAQIKTHNFDVRLVIIGDKKLIMQRAEQLGSSQQYTDYVPGQNNTNPDLLEILQIPLSVPCKAGELNKKNADYVLKTLERACKGCLSGEFDAMVTAPVQKDIINEAGIPFSGHTEYLAEICAGDTLRVTTTHIDWPYLDPQGNPQSNQMRYAETFALSEEGTLLEYSITFTDPTIYRDSFTLDRLRRWTPERELEPFNCVAEWEASTVTMTVASSETPFSSDAVYENRSLPEKLAAGEYLRP